MQAEKNLAWEAAQAQSASVAQMSSLATAGAGPCKLYVKNLHPNITVSPGLQTRLLPLLTPSMGHTRPWAGRHAAVKLQYMP